MTEKTSAPVAPMVSVAISSAWDADDEAMTSDAQPAWLPSMEFCETCLSASIALLRHRSASPSDDSEASEHPALDYGVSLRIADAAESEQLNSTYRGRSKPTNVLSFPLAEEAAQWLPIHENSDSAGGEEASGDAAVILLGDLVLCPAIVEREASEQDKTLENHWAHLLIHGLFHLLGFDHIDEDDAEEMESLEVDVLRSLEIPNPYLLD